MLEPVIDWILYTLFGLNPDLRWVESVHFFLYDAIKILLLLGIFITLIGILRTYLPQEKIKGWIAHRRFGGGYVFASLFGAVTPFCSCSSIPFFLSFLKAGVPLGVTFSFLITSPLVNEYLVILMLGFFGWKITLAYVLFGILIGVVSGFILGRMKLGRYLVTEFFEDEDSFSSDENHHSFQSRIRFGVHEAGEIIRKIWVWILVGVGIGALIHNFVPADMIQTIVATGGVLAVPLAVLLGVPLYGSCAAIVPIAVVLFEKGMPLGTALAFMMAMAALSIPQAVILRRAMKLHLIAIFFGIVTLGIIISGYLFNALELVLIG